MTWMPAESDKNKCREIKTQRESQIMMVRQKKMDKNNVALVRRLDDLRRVICIIDSVHPIYLQDNHRKVIRDV